ncbi:MAG: TDP-4-keto-6-deoxy-D-glucose transaminase, partial [Candidatus Moranbacteria bacterium GW2011_GWF1_36_4]
MKILFNIPAYAGNELRYISEVFKNRKLSGDGEFTKKCSLLMEEKFNAKKVLLTTSGTHALDMAALLLNLKPGDEVIVPAFGCAVLASSALWVNAQPVFADVRKDDYGIDPDAVEKKITERTKAIIVAHLFGQPTGGMEKIMQIARRHNLVVIEDAAQAFGAHIHIAGEWRGVGTLGDVGCFSF